MKFVSPPPIANVPSKLCKSRHRNHLAGQLDLKGRQIGEKNFR